MQKEKTEGLLEDESIEEIHREPAKPVSKKWKILDEDGLRNRYGLYSFLSPRLLSCFSLCYV